MAVRKEGEINLAAIKKVLTVAREKHEELGLLLDELDVLVGGGKGIGEVLTECYNQWNDLWSTRHGGKYLFNFKVDAGHMKRLVRELGKAELFARIYNYIKDNEPFVSDRRHPFALFVSNNNRYASAAPVDVEAPVGCLHTPPCRNDVEHTKRRQQEMAQ